MTNRRRASHSGISICWRPTMRRTLRRGPRLICCWRSFSGHNRKEKERTGSAKHSPSGGSFAEPVRFRIRTQSLPLASERAHSVPQRRSRRVPFRSVEAGAFRSVSALWRKLHIHFPASPYRITTTSLGRDARGEKAPHGPDHPLLPLRGNSPCPFPRSSFSRRNHFVGLRREISPPAGGVGAACVF